MTARPVQALSAVTPSAEDLLPMLTYHTYAYIQVDAELSSFCMYRCLMVTWHTCIKLVSLPRIRMRLWTAGHVITFWLLRLTGTLFPLYDTTVGVGISCVCECKKNMRIHICYCSDVMAWILTSCFRVYMEGYTYQTDDVRPAQLVHSHDHPLMCTLMGMGLASCGYITTYCRVTAGV